MARHAVVLNFQSGILLSRIYSLCILLKYLALVTLYIGVKLCLTFSCCFLQPLFGICWLSKPICTICRELLTNHHLWSGLMLPASRFHLGRQHQHSAVICSGALLFSSRVLCPSLVTLCSHKSGRCTVELYHASHLWYPLFYTSPIASSALQH